MGAWGWGLTSNKAHELMECAHICVRACPPAPLDLVTVMHDPLPPVPTHTHRQ